MEQIVQNGMGAYEILFILKTSVSDDEIKNEIEKIKAVIAQREGEVAGVENIGKRRLAYEIKKERRGIFIYIHFKGNRNTVSALQRFCRLQEAIMRFMLVKIKLKDLKSAVETQTTPLEDHREAALVDVSPT